VLAAVVIMLSPLETGTTRGRRRERGRSRETGPSRGYLAPAGGARRAAKTRQLASRRGGAGRGPSISYMEGPCLIQPGGNVLPGPGDPRLPLRHVVVLAQAGGQRRRRLSPGSVSVSRTRRRQDHDERDSRQAPGDAGRLPAGYAASIRCPPSWAMAQARSASCGPAASREHRHADALTDSPAGERVTGCAVHNHVDHLCKTAPGLCAHWGNAGDRVTGPRR